MKVLFAFNNEKGVNQIAEFYKDHYGEKLEVTKVFFFRSLIDTLRKNKNFDRIVIHEDLEPTGSKNQDAIDKYLFNNFDKVTDEAGRADIIVVCTERRKQNDKFVKTLFNLGIYNILTGPDRTVGKVTELINRPRTKKEAKLFVDADLEENPYEAVDKIDELELRNIIKYYEKNIFSKDKIVSGFDSLYEQYTFENLKQIVPFLPIKAREVLEQESQKYIALMNYKPPKGGKHEQVRVVEVPVYIQQEPEPKKEEPVKKPVVEEVKQEPIREPESKFKYTPPQVEEDRDVILRRNNIPKEPEVVGPISEVKESKVEEVITTVVAPVAAIVEKVEEIKEEPKVEEPIKEEKIEPVKVEPVEPKIEEVKKVEPVIPRIDLEAERSEGPKQEVKIEKEFTVPKIDLLSKKEEEPKIEIELEKVEEVKPEPPKVEPVVPKIEEVKPEPVKVEPVVPKVEEVKPEPVKVEPVVPKVEEVKPEPTKVEPVVPKVEEVKPEPKKVEPVVPKVEEVKPEPIKVEPVVPKVEEVKPEPIKVEPVVPKVEEVKPEPVKVEPVVPKVEQKPKIPVVEPEIVRPQPAQTAPERPSYAPPKYQPPRPTVSDNKFQTVTQVIEKEVIKSVYEPPKDYKKVACFVGAHKTGTTFIINAVASLLVSRGIKVAILDLTSNKDTYMIYTSRDIEQRDVAGNSLNNLGIGQNKPFVLGNLSVYTGIPRTSKNKIDVYKAIEIAKKDNSVVLIDCDFATKKDLPDVFRYAQTIYVVQDMDTLNILPMTMFLKELKNSDVDNSKISVIINKYIKSILKVDDILGALMNYTSPDLSVMEEDLLSKRPGRFIVPFDEQNYLRYIEGVYSGKMNYNGFSEEFKQAISMIIHDIFPIEPGSPGMKRQEEGGFLKKLWGK